MLSGKMTRVVLALALLSLMLCLCTASASAEAPAAPKPSVSNIVLRYFDIRGLAEPIRLVLAYLAVPYTEINYANCGESCPEGTEDWQTAKAAGLADGSLPFGQAPRLDYVDEEGEAHTLVQSQAILRFLGRKFHLSPFEELDLERAAIYSYIETQLQREDIIIGGLTDMRGKYGKFVYNKEATSDPVRNTYKETLKAWLPFFEKLMFGGTGRSGKAREFLVSNSPTIADFLAFDMLDSNLRVDPSCLASLPQLKALVYRVANLPSISSYLSSGRRHPYSNGATASFDTPASPPAWVGQYDNQTPAASYATPETPAKSEL